MEFRLSLTKNNKTRSRIIDTYQKRAECMAREMYRCHSLDCVELVDVASGMIVFSKTRDGALNDEVIAERTV
jgi:hypothetical protein